MKINQTTKIGIWGFGLVGQSLFKYLTKHGYTNLLIFDTKDITILAGCQLAPSLDFLLNSCDYIFPSPGIDLDPYQVYHTKFIAELDLFAQNWHNPIIAITGSIGKTTLTTLLANTLDQAGIKTIAAGNVGLPMCDIVDSDYEKVVLELSSFQLELAQNFAPDLAIWTNLYPNHLDRHKTIQRYLLAKANIFLRQSCKQIVLLPLSLLPDLMNLDFKSQLYVFGEVSELSLLDRLPVNFKAKILGSFVIQGQQVWLLKPDAKIKIGVLDQFKNINTYQINLLILLVVSYLLKIKLPKNLVFKPIAHRLELFYTSPSGIVFYNDSKSTVAQSTLAAVQKLAAGPIILFLGGLSKGVDRTSLIKNLVGKVKIIICFGAEASSLGQMCQAKSIPSAEFLNLPMALDYCAQIAKPGDQVLFSPAGSSFDLFRDYMQRGEEFKKLVLLTYA